VIWRGLGVCAGLVAIAIGVAAQSGDVRVTTDVSARRVYVGERVTLVYSLARDLPATDEDALITPVRDVRLVEPPRFADFWVNELETDDAAGPSGPTPVGSVPLRRLRLFPLVAGTLRVDPPAYSMVVYPTTLADPMPGTVTRRAEPATIEVFPLPAAGRPSTFGGAVGRFAVSAALERPSGETGQVSRVRVEVRGDGNVEATGPPRLASPDGVRVFPARRESVDLGLSDPSAEASAVWLLDLIPEREGTIALGAAALMLGRRRRRPAADADAPAPQARPQIPAAEVARLRVRLAHAVAEAEAAREAGDARALHARLLDAIGDLAATLFGLPRAELSRERLDAAFAAGDVPRPVVDRVLRLYDVSVESSFAPRAGTASREPIEAAARLFEALVRSRTGST
jgi:hypothetical protein